MNKIYLAENSGGPTKPINIGIKNSSGFIYYYFRSDDEILPEKLEKQNCKI